MSNIDKLKPGKYAILFRNNWDGEGDTYETFAILDAEGIWRDEDGDELFEYQGDEVLKAWPMDDVSNVLALLDEVEAAEKRIAELEARTVTLPENITSANAPEVFEISSEAERLGLRGTYASYAVGWNARGIADKEALREAGVKVAAAGKGE